MTDVPTLPRPLGRGERLDWYRVERVLGRGGFGIVYLARDTNLERDVAIKEYLPGELVRRGENGHVAPPAGHLEAAYRSGLERFIAEARNLARFGHPSVVRVMSVFRLNGTAYMVMELEVGTSLRERFASHPAARSQAALTTLVARLAEGLAEVHRRGFVHRDIKPSNILVRADGSPVLIDFGSARQAEGAAAGAAGEPGPTAIVSAGYAPLEQYGLAGSDARQGAWSDVYALGGVLYFAVSGNDPPDSTRRAAAIFNGGRYPLMPALLVGEGRYGATFLRAIDRALSVRVADRPGTLEEWVAELTADAGPGEPGARPETGEPVGPGADAPTAPFRGTGERPAAVSDPAARGLPAPSSTDTRARRARLPRGVAVALAVLLPAGAALLFVSPRDRAEEVPAASPLGAEGLDEGERRPGSPDAGTDGGRPDGSTGAVRAGGSAGEAAAAARRAGEARVVEARQAAEAARARREAEAARVAEVERAAAAERAAEAERAAATERAAELERATEPDEALSVDDAAVAAAAARFEALRVALERFDAETMDALTEASGQNRLFRQLFEQFESLDLSLSDIRVRDADGTIAATLSIRTMRRANGDRATPSDAYRDRDLVSWRDVDGNWSSILW